MKQIYTDLWQTSVEHPFSGVSTHAYLLVQDTGNVLFYNTGLQHEYPQIKALGGLDYQFLSHRDEVGPSLAEIKEVFGSKLCCHKLEEGSVKSTALVDYLFYKRETLLGNIEIIPTPGHTDGSVCFLVHSAHGGKYLFTGDTIYLSNGVWESRINGYAGGSKSDIKNSLILLKDIEPTVVISSASVGNTPFKEVSAEEWRLAVDNVVQTLS
jgi:glyoxylase-like metal-dependent hydrolase (beta-lactamase superfamily II)